jgi:fructose-1,6-bisphosphatase/inositol monophosphatase family enzyme
LRKTRNRALEVGLAARIDASAALIAEAGGIITDIRGREIRFNNRNVKLEGLIADNGYLHQALVKVAPRPDRKS